MLSQSEYKCNGSGQTRPPSTYKPPEGIEAALNASKYPSFSFQLPMTVLLEPSWGDPCGVDCGDPGGLVKMLRM